MENSDNQGNNGGANNFFMMESPPNENGVNLTKPNMNNFNNAGLPPSMAESFNTFRVFLYITDAEDN